MTTGERLVQLAGTSGQAHVLLLLIGSGGTAGAALQNFSKLPDGIEAYVHLLQNPDEPPFVPRQPPRPPAPLPYTRGRVRLTDAQAWRDRYYRLG
jgi:hypothetical protein